MAVRAASWAFLGILLTGVSWAAGPPATTPGADPFRHGFEPQDRSARLYAGRPLPRHPRHPPGDVSIAGQGRRERPRPDQGVSLRPDDARRVAHGARSGQARP